MFFNKKKKDQIVYGLINCIVLEKDNGIATNYFLTLEKYSTKSYNVMHDNLYLWYYY
ncbi:hypothetical protein SAMN02745176_03423 [Lutispora thermophila DSM 19022]|uniref:Uncharacterized protein n=1 Tax=Lutispora thermophila DSM 19022 TaxID=1122184 RepID=A0A1M6IX20_9FIRM|nr:hypothetical protein SAMN02745176_03423 [Lutispora thermophila DSM 19022]